MNPEVKQKWYDALVSGEYKQTNEYLRDNKGYCCLGVLTDIYLKEHNKQWEKQEEDPDVGTITCYSFEKEAATLPESVMNWAELNSADPLISVSEELSMQCLSKLNDEGMDFPTIANLIMEKL